MSAPRTGTARWLSAFVVLAAAAVLSVLWTLRGERAAAPLPGAAGVDADAARSGAATEREDRLPLARLYVTPPSAGSVTLAAADAGAALLSLDGPARLDAGQPDGDAYRILPDGPAGPLTVALSRSAAWIIDVDPGAESVRLSLGQFAVDTLRLGAPLGSVAGTLPRSGHLDVALGSARASLHVGSGSRLDADLTLGTGALLLQIDPGVSGRVVLRAGSGPATVIVDAASIVALHLPINAPPLALEGTWWRHRVPSGVIWVRSPLPALPDDADVTLSVRHHVGAPLAVTYR
ncbi:MAG: hypothetical protein EA416_10470 [Trueperaceae bacterium]|nr:MAG: hypothetical protein EA416_10470 [Trueperaceae bacterium]